METLRPNQQRAKYAIILIWVIMGIELISFASGYMQYRLLQSAAEGNYVSMNEAEANDLRERTVGIIFIIVYLISAVTFIQWFRRAYYNLHQKTDYLSYTEGWAAGSWFVPILNLFRPYQIMKELYQRTSELLTSRGISFYSSLSTSIVSAWWILWVISAISGRILYSYTRNAATLEESISATTAGMVLNIFDIIVGVLAIKVIGNYAKVEPLLFDIAEEDNTGEEHILTSMEPLVNK